MAFGITTCILPLTNSKHVLSTLIRATLLTLVVTACGGGADTESNPAGGSGQQSTYTGPPPEFPDVQAFRVNLWENIRGTNRCGQCHVPGTQAPFFARSDNVNDAYDEALLLVELDNPALSRLVEKVGLGHNCWLADDQACADIMTTWIEGWAGGSGNAGREILLVAPVIKDPGDSKNFPDSPIGYGPIYFLLTDQNEGDCSRCHSSEAEIPISPYFAAADINEAYEAARSKINLDLPMDSRFVARLRDEFHNCWTNSCAADAQELEDAITAFAATIPTDSVDAAMVISKALQLGDGIIASGGDRHEANQIAFWEFKTGTGSVAYDTSGVDPAIDLSLSGDIEWVGGWGININSGKAQGFTSSSTKLQNAIVATGEFAVEAWVAPANVTQEDAYIVSYSGSNTTRNFTLGQTLYNYDFMTRSSSAGPPPDTTAAENGMPALSTADADERLQATLQHVVINYDPVNGRSIYVNGQWTGDIDPVPGGTLGSWRNNFALVLGNETSNERQWQGVIRMVAIHNLTLTAEQIQQNFDVGVGEKFFLLFYLGDVLTTINEPYLLIEVSQYDSYSYLFHEPRFISLDPDENPGDVDIAGIRIGINGRLADVGQGFQKIDTRDPSFTEIYGPDGQLLSPQGTVIAVEKGPDQDEFFLSFDVLGSATNFFTEQEPLLPADPPDGAPVPDFGLRTFEEINATLSTITTVNSQEINALNTYNRVRQQLPTVENLAGFLAAHQMAIAQMAIEYCNALVNDADKRDSYWDAVSFPTPTNPSTAASMDALFGPAADRNDILDPLLDRLALPESPDAGLTSQPDITDTKTELNSLIDKLTACMTPTDTCDAGYSNTVLKAVCSAAVGNAGMLIQ